MFVFGGSLLVFSLGGFLLKASHVQRRLLPEWHMRDLGLEPRLLGP